MTLTEIAKKLFHILLESRWKMLEQGNIHMNARGSVASDYIILIILYIRQGRPSGIGPISEPDWMMGDR